MPLVEVIDVKGKKHFGELIAHVISDNGKDVFFIIEKGKVIKVVGYLKNP